MTLIPADTSDQSALLQQVLNAGNKVVVFAPGYHLLASTVNLPLGVELRAHNATVDLEGSGWGFYAQGPITFRGGKWITQQGTLQLVTGTGGSPSAYFDSVDMRVRVTSQNITTVGAVDSAFHEFSDWNGAKVSNCCFFADCYIYGSSMTFTDNEMKARLICQKIMTNARIQRIKWINLISRINDGECLLVENATVTGCLFDNLEFMGCSGPVIEVWNVNGVSTFNKNTISNVVSAGPSNYGINLLGSAGGNQFFNISLRNLTLPICLDSNCAANSFDNVYIMNCTPVVGSDGFGTGQDRDWNQAIDPATRFIILDNGTATTFGNVYVEDTHGVQISNHPERIANLHVN